MAETVRLRIEVEDDSIIVTLPGTTFRVIYGKSNDAPGLFKFALQAAALKTLDWRNMDQERTNETRDHPGRAD